MLLMSELIKLTKRKYRSEYKQIKQRFLKCTPKKSQRFSNNWSLGKTNRQALATPRNRREKMQNK